MAKIKDIHFFESISIKTPLERIYKRLKYEETLTRLPAQQKNEFNRFVDDAMSLLTLKGSSLRLPIQEKDSLKVILGGGIIFKSKLLATLLKNSEEILCMGLTAGSKIIDAIEDSQKNNLTRSVVFDAVASEAVDACFPWVQDCFNQELNREGKSLLLKRVSCGYGDFRLEYQKVMYNILELKRLGIKITEKYILIPEKSVTAVTGIVGVR